MDFFSRSKLIIADWGLSTNLGKFSYYTVLLWSKLIWIVIFFSCSVDGAVVISVPSSSKVTETLHKIGKWRMKFSSRRVRCVKHCSRFLFFFWPTFILLKLKIYLKTDNWIKYDRISASSLLPPRTTTNRVSFRLNRKTRTRKRKK